MVHVGIAEIALVLGQIVLAWVAWLQRKNANDTNLRLTQMKAQSEAARRDDENVGGAINLASVMANNLQAQTTHFNALTSKLLGMDTVLTRVDESVEAVHAVITTADERMTAAAEGHILAQAAILEAIEGVPSRTASQVEDRLVGRFETMGNELAQLMAMSRGTSQASQETNDKARKLWGEWKELAPQLRAWLTSRDVLETNSAAATESTDNIPRPASADNGTPSESVLDIHKEQTGNVHQ